MIRVLIFHTVHLRPPRSLRPPPVSYLAARIWPRLHTAMGLKKVEAEDEEGNPCHRAAAEATQRRGGAQQMAAAADTGREEEGEEAWSTAGG